MKFEKSFEFGGVGGVAPFTGAWIEMRFALDDDSVALRSLPSRERGLKSSTLMRRSIPLLVAPFTGAWIEIVVRYAYHA